MPRTITFRAHPTRHQYPGNEGPRDWLVGIQGSLYFEASRPGSTMSKDRVPDTHTVSDDWPDSLRVLGFDIPVPDELRHTDTWEHWVDNYPGWQVCGINNSPLAALAIADGFPAPVPLANVSVQFSPAVDLQVLAGLPDMTHLSLRRHERLMSLDILAHLKDLACLNLDTGSILPDLQPLTTLTSLNKLELSGYNADIRPLSALTQLRHLRVASGPQLVDIGPLSTLINLVRLDLLGLIAFTDLSPLAPLSHLKHLDLTYCTQVHDLAPLANLTALEVVNLSLCQMVSDLRPLAHLPLLRTLMLEDCWRIPPEIRETVENGDSARFRALLTGANACQRPAN